MPHDDSAGTAIVIHHRPRRALYVCQDITNAIASASGDAQRRDVSGKLSRGCERSDLMRPSVAVIDELVQPISVATVVRWALQEARVQVRDKLRVARAKSCIV